MNTEKPAYSVQQGLLFEDPRPKRLPGEVAFRKDGQNAIVFAFFQAHPKKYFTPLQVYLRLSRKHKVLTQGNVRRTITVLTGLGLLTHHKNIKVAESTGYHNTVWQYNSNNKPTIQTDDKEGNDHHQL